MPLQSVNKHREQRYGTFCVTYPVIQISFSTPLPVFETNKVFFKDVLHKIIICICQHFNPLPNLKHMIGIIIRENVYNYGRPLE